MAHSFSEVIKIICIFNGQNGTRTSFSSSASIVPCCSHVLFVYHLHYIILATDGVVKCNVRKSKYINYVWKWRKEYKYVWPIWRLVFINSSWHTLEYCRIAVSQAEFWIGYQKLEQRCSWKYKTRSLHLSATWQKPKW